VARISDDGKPLLLHAIAEASQSMLDASGDLKLDHLNRDRLLDAILARERRTFWPSAAGVSDPEKWDEKLPQHESAIALATLTRGLPFRLAKAALTAVAQLGPATQDYTRLCDGLETILRRGGLTSDCRVRPMEPDLFW